MGSSGVGPIAGKRAISGKALAAGLAALLAAAIWPGWAEAHEPLSTIERNALEVFYFATGGPSWSNNTGWLGEPGTECSWYGVACGGASGQTPWVKWLTFPGGNNLTGALPPALGSLSKLQKLWVHCNSLTGALPAELGTLAELEELVAGNNQLTGTLAPWISQLANLRQLGLQNNQLEDGLPTELGQLSKLESLTLDRNQLSGPIPSELGNLSLLRQLYLFDNELTGEIPTSFENLLSMEEMQLQENQLDGEIPAGMGNLAALRHLSLAVNQLSGGIPSTFGQLANLEVLQLTANDLTGSIPSGFGNLAKLCRLDLSANHFSGQLPTQLGDLTSLESLMLQGNDLIHAVPTELLNLVNLADGGSDFRWNALYSEEAAVRQFLASKQAGGDWESTQTVTPTGVTVATQSSTSVTVSWTPIVYTDDPGGYRVAFSWYPYPPCYSEAGTTASKADSSLTVDGLTAGRLYFFVVRTITFLHSRNPNTVMSGYSSPVPNKPSRKVRRRLGRGGT